MVTHSISVRLPREDHAWVAGLARANHTPDSAMMRALIHGLRLAVAEGRIKELDMGVLSLKP